MDSGAQRPVVRLPRILSRRWSRSAGYPSGLAAIIPNPAASVRGRLLNLRIADDIDQETYARKGTELRDRPDSIKLQLDALDRSHVELAEPRRCLNFLKLFGSNDLPQIARQSVESSKSCV